MARLCGVTKHTLFHYHQIGVFSPAVTGENGYRYYTPPQVEVFGRDVLLTYDLEKER